MNRYRIAAACCFTAVFGIVQVGIYCLGRSTTVWNFEHTEVLRGHDAGLYTLYLVDMILVVTSILPVLIVAGVVLLRKGNRRG